MFIPAVKGWVDGGNIVVVTAAGEVVKGKLESPYRDKIFGFQHFL